MAQKKPYYRNIMISPDGGVFVEEGFEEGRPYFHSKFFVLTSTKPYKTDDVKLQNGDFVHTEPTKEGLYILILQHIK